MFVDREAFATMLDVCVGARSGELFATAEDLGEISFSTRRPARRTGASGTARARTSACSEV
jgi:hypothetical protein